MRDYIHKRMKVSFWLHPSKTAGMAQIYCRITIQGTRADIGSTGITIPRSQWDAPAKRIKSKNPLDDLDNDLLMTTELRLRATYIDLLSRGASITPGKIKRIYLKGGDSVTLVAAFQLYLDEVKRNPKLADSTYTVYNNVRKKLLDFLISEKATDIPMVDFELGWLNRYRLWMASIPVDNASRRGKPSSRPKIGHADNYIRKQTQTILQVARWAKLHQLTPVNNLEGYRVPGADNPSPLFLTDGEFKRLRRHKFDNPAEQEVADLFILMCRTGFHYGDMIDFIKKARTALQRGIDGELWLIKERIKTGITSRIPQSPEMESIVKKYGGWERLPVVSNKTMNDWLKHIARELGFHPDLSSKAGRKTFTDWCFNSLDMSTEAIMVMLGRKTSRGLEVYGRPDDRRVLNELKKSKTYQDAQRRSDEAGPNQAGLAG